MKLLLLSAALLLLLPAARPEGHQPESELAHFSLVVRNKLDNKLDLLFNTTTIKRGILLGGLKRLMKTNAAFRFTYSEDPNYGPYLESVNGLAGSDRDHTYWELLVQSPGNQIIRPNVGIGCYIPNSKDTIILNFTTW